MSKYHLYIGLPFLCLLLYVCMYVCMYVYMSIHVMFKIHRYTYFCIFIHVQFTFEVYSDLCE